MHIDKYKQKNGWYKDKDECEYEFAEEFYQTGIFGFCGCGCPEDSLKYIAKGLSHIKRLKTNVWGTGDEVLEESELMSYKEWNDEGLDLFKTEEQMWFFMYWADKEELTEHGGNVSGGWLTDKGYEVLEDLTQLNKEE
jgi:hypothetical protein